ncbi:hypothetical protein PTKIN_Ptkin03bG0234000 [Pterospermum kingtungense]
MEAEEERKKRPENGGVSGEESPASKRKKEAGTAESNDDVMEWLLLEGGGSESESMSELLKLLDDDVDVVDSAGATTRSALSSSWTPSPTTSYGIRVRFSDNPYSSALIFQSSSSYITINGNEESCGSSFSDSDSSVMASVDMGGIVSVNAKKVGSSGSGLLKSDSEEGEGAWGKGEEEAHGWMVDWEWEWDEDQLARFLDEEAYLFY